MTRALVGVLVVLALPVAVAHAKGPDTGRVCGASGCATLDPDLIGKEPEIGEEFDLEASIEGRFTIEGLSRRGLAFE